MKISKEINSKSLSFICLSSTRWVGKWERMQQLSLALSKRSNVLYLDPVVSIKEAKDFIKKVLGLITPLKFLFKKSANLYTYPLVAVLPFGRISCIKKINYYFIKRAINVLKRELNLSNSILIIWDFWEGLDFVRILDSKMVIFDYFDNYLEYRDYSPREKNGIQRKLIGTIKQSDIVFATSQNLYQDARRYHGNVRLLPNGVDFESYLHPAGAAEEIQELSRPIIGYMGGNNFSTCAKIDYDLLDFVTDHMSEASFLFIGPVGSHKKNDKLERMKLRKNVFFIGQKDPKELPSWLKKCAVFMLPWKINAFTESVYPLKLNEYFACGKPVVSTRLASLIDVDKDDHDLVYLADDYVNFIDMLRKALDENNRSLESKRISVAEANSWDRRASDIFAAVESYLNKE